MNADTRKLARLLRLERVRAITRQTAAADAAAAETTLSHLHDLAGRTRDLASDYASRRDIHTGADLARLGQFSQGLHTILASTQADVSRARAVADRRLALLASAERARVAAEDRATRTAQAIVTRAQSDAAPPAMPQRRGAFGTDVE